ncbi:hypothetical protein [Knoellia locipacati]|nr:hypothetical protein [Knoellia locipacati]
MSSRAPFFEPPLPPADDMEEPGGFVNLPWTPPMNVVPVSVPVDADVFVSDSVVVRVPEIQVFDRGMLLRLEAWVHPEAAVRAAGVHGLPEEPRLGILLGDGTKLGSGEPGHSPDVAPDEPGSPERPSLVMNGGGGGELRTTQSWWLHPVPDRDAELVVEWEALEVPETFVPLDLVAVREASTRARVLWHVPDADYPEGGWFGWSTIGGSVYSGSPEVQGDDPRDGRA